MLLAALVLVVAGAWAVAALAGPGDAAPGDTASADTASADTGGPAAPAPQRPLPTMTRTGPGDPLDEDYFLPFHPPGWVQESQDGGREYAQGPCADASIGVEVTMDRRNFTVGDQPRFVLVVTNRGDKTCARDLGAALQQLTVTKVDGPQVWRNQDCVPGSGRDAWTLTPGERAAFATIWTGTTSVPGCGGNRVPVQPGLYDVVASLGPIASAPMRFAVNPVPPAVPPPVALAPVPVPAPTPGQ